MKLVRVLVLASPARPHFPILGVTDHIAYVLGDSFPSGALQSITTGRDSVPKLPACEHGSDGSIGSEAHPLSISVIPACNTSLIMMSVKCHVSVRWRATSFHCVLAGFGFTMHSGSIRPG